MGSSPQGRRVLVALVTGDPGDRIQAWRERNDARQAQRIPPHATLCYWVPEGDSEALDRQVRYAFPEPVEVRLGSVHVFDNVDRTMYIDVQDTSGLDAARERLYDGAVIELPARDRHWTWHVTCVRSTIGRDLGALEAEAAALTLETPWRIDTIACLELRGDTYHEVARWQLDPVSATIAPRA